MFERFCDERLSKLRAKAALRGAGAGAGAGVDAGDGEVDHYDAALAELRMRRLPTTGEPLFGHKYCEFIN